MEIISLPPSSTQEYLCLRDLNLYNSPSCQELATQAQRGRKLKFISLEILPEWYLYPVFQILRILPNKLLGIACMAGVPPAVWASTTFR